MAGDYLNHVAAGAPLRFSTRRENLISEVARNFQRNRKPIGADPTAIYSPDQLVWVRNDSGDDAQEYDVLGISGMGIGPTDNLNNFKWTRPVLTAVTPTQASHFGKFVIPFEPIADGKVGRAFIAGACVAYIDMKAAGDRYADVTDGDSDHLTSGDIGAAEILWAASGTGIQWAFVRLGHLNTGLFEVSLASDGGATGSKTATATWTYTAKSLSGGITYGTHLTPKRPRRNGTDTAATLGAGYFDKTATFQLYEALEGRGTMACS
jgi:hypothetical protein